MKPQFYATLAQFALAPGSTRRSMSLVVRTDGDPKKLVTAVAAQVKAADPRLPVSEVRTMRDIVNAAIGGQRFAMETLGVFGARGAAALGDRHLRHRVAGGGVAPPRVGHSRRARRDADGLDERLHFALVFDRRWPGWRSASSRRCVLTRVLHTLLHGVTPTDPLTFVAVVVVTGLVAVIASVAPAGRAARVDPNIALRAD